MLHLCLRKLPLFHQTIPFFQADIARPYPWKAGLLTNFQWVFASSLAIIHLNKLTTLSLRDIPPLKPFERRDHFTDIYGVYSNADPADVALVSPQTPLTPLYSPLLSGVCRRRHPWVPFCLRAFSGFFASSLAIIHLNKLTTLSLRDIPPLKPFERRDKPTDIHDDLACIAIWGWVCIAPLVDQSKAQVI